MSMTYSRFATMFVCLFGFATCPVAAQEPDTAPTYTTFDVPGATGTAPTSFNSAGTVAGIYSDPESNGTFTQGFVRTSDGTITTFMAPVGIYLQGTFAEAVNDHGTVAGYYLAETGNGNGQFFTAYFGYVRTSSGVFTTFSAPGAGMYCVPFCGTAATGINESGVVTGWYLDANLVSHGFVGLPGQTITSFDPPGSVSTYASSINSSGTVAGYYGDAASVTHAFIRSADGTITSFDAPGTGTRAFTEAWGINNAGSIVGDYVAANGSHHGFVRASSGVVSEFQAVNAAPGYGTHAVSISADGSVTGYANRPNELSTVGFVRRPTTGAIATFRAPGAGATSDEGTFPVSINSSNAVAGYYTDSNGVQHGFIRVP